MIQELDCVNILKKLRTLDVISTILLDYPQKQLLKYQKQNLLQEATYSSDEDSHTTLTHSITESVASLKSSNRHKQVLKEFMSKKKLTPIDRKLLSGIISRNPYTLVNDKGYKEDKNKVS